MANVKCRAAFEHLDLFTALINGDILLSRIDDQHHAATGIEPAKRLFLDLAVAVRWREDFDSQVGRTGPISGY